MQTHAILDKESRDNKAKKIAQLASMQSPLKMSRMLEVGSGSGFIVSYFSKLGYGKEGSYAVDVADERQTHNDYKFQVVSDTSLPFQDAYFDFIISNHVIEHVGPRPAQEEHISELYRCLEPGGKLYLAVPNRWRLVEPHYRLPLLSWLPRGLSDRYLRLTKAVNYYDCHPLSARDAQLLLKKGGFEVSDVTLEAISVTGRIEGGKLLQLITEMPKTFWNLFSPIMPTLIFICEKPNQ